MSGLDTTDEFLLFVLLKILKLVKKIYTQHLQKKTLMEIRKCLDKVAVSPNCIKQWLGVVLVHKRLETTNNNLLCFDSSLSKWTSTSSIRLTSSYHVNILASNSVTVSLLLVLLASDSRILSHPCSAAGLLPSTYR